MTITPIGSPGPPIHIRAIIAIAPAATAASGPKYSAQILIITERPSNMIPGSTTAGRNIARAVANPKRHPRISGPRTRPSPRRGEMKPAKPLNAIRRPRLMARSKIIFEFQGFFVSASAKITEGPIADACRKQRQIVRLGVYTTATDCGSALSTPLRSYDSPCLCCSGEGLCHPRPGIIFETCHIDRRGSRTSGAWTLRDYDQKNSTKASRTDPTRSYDKGDLRRGSKTWAIWRPTSEC